MRCAWGFSCESALRLALNMIQDSSMILTILSYFKCCVYAYVYVHLCAVDHGGQKKSELKMVVCRLI